MPVVCKDSLIHNAEEAVSCMQHIVELLLHSGMGFFFCAAN